MDEIQDFGWALGILGRGLKVARQGWEGPSIRLFLQTAAADSKKIYLYTEIIVNPCDAPRGSRVLWQPSQTDILARDWAIVE